VTSTTDSANLSRALGSRASLRRSSRLSLAAKVFGSVLLCASALGAQVEQEDLVIEESLIPITVSELFEEAKLLFDTTDQADSLPMFSSVITELTPLAAGGDSEVLAMLEQALLLRIRGNFNFGEREAVETDMTQLVELVPDLQLDRAEVSSRLADLYDAVRSRRVGFLDLEVDPPDARLWIRGEALAARSTPYALLAGAYAAELRRSGYTIQALAFDIEPGKTVAETVQLERTSAVVALRTRPSDATIFIEGREIGRTSGQADDTFQPLGEAAARYSSQEFSRESEFDGILPGSYTLEIRKSGFRPFRAQLEIGNLDDYRFEPVVLEAEEGTLVLRSLPADAEVMLDGARLRPTVAPDGTAQLLMAPGNYRLTVARGSSGRFEGVVDILDRSTVTLDVRLRPALVLLGILGKDDVAAERLGDEISDAFRRADNWIVLDRTADARPTLTSLGLDTADLRAAAKPGADSNVDWSKVQAWADEQFQGSAYMLGVLADDLIASEADLWIVSAAPGPSNPERRRVEVASRLALPEFALGFEPELKLERATLGADLIDSELAAGAVVARVTPGSAADRAGLVPGNEIATFGEISSPTASQIAEALVEHDVAEPVTLSLVGGGQPLEFLTDRSFTVIDFTDPDLIYPAMFATLNAELERRSAWPRWLLQLNQAALLLRAGAAEEAIRTLRKIEVSSVPATPPAGLGRSSIDYLLGLALTEAGPRYLETAREAFARAASAETERLFHNDGPLIAPRANARLERLGGAPQ
jgi:hypothetical protein